MDKEYIYQSRNNRKFAGSKAVIVLPDIYMQTDYSKTTVEKLAEIFKKPVFMLDYFYLLTNQVNVLSENDREKAHDLMQSFKADEFVNFFKKILAEIKKAYPTIRKFSVIGFCFGGRLAYIAGSESEFDVIISFYGGGAHTPNYIQSKTPIDYLISKRKNSNLKVFSFFGIQDLSIPESDREKTREMFGASSISYQAFEYDAGHAYFQEGRKNFNQNASSASWKILKKIFKQNYE